MNRLPVVFYHINVLELYDLSILDDTYLCSVVFTEMVKGFRKEKHSRNILKKIEKGFGGPLDMLKVYMNEKKRVKVSITISIRILSYR